MDQISHLPKTILHDILGRLPDKDAAKTSVLSKVVIVIEYVKKRLVKLREQGLGIKELKLSLTEILDHRQVAHHVDEWIQMACESGVQVLELHLSHGSMDTWYNLPLCLTEAKSLTKLVLSGGIRIDPTFLNHSLKFPSMRILSLSNILFGGQGALEHFISHYPLIEYLILRFCYVYDPLSVGDHDHPPCPRIYRVESLSLHGLQNLKGADIQGIQELYIDAPNLEYLCYSALVMDAPFKLNLDSCTNLRWLSLWYLMSKDKWLLEQLCKIPFLESLMLYNCSLAESIIVSGPQLKFFMLSDCSDLMEVNIDAPNLLTYNYIGDDKPAISFLGISNKLMKVNYYIGINDCDPCTLREFVQNIEPQEVFASLSLFIYEPYFYFYEKLMGSKKRKCYCRSRGFKCWWHGLKVGKITHLERTSENVEDHKAMLDALSESDAEEFVTFGLKL